MLSVFSEVLPALLEARQQHELHVSQGPAVCHHQGDPVTLSVLSPSEVSPTPNVQAR